MLDMVFVVDDPLSWHTKNLELNWSHYSFLRRFGPKCITYTQGCSAGVYYNTLVKIGTQVYLSLLILSCQVLDISQNELALSRGFSM